MADYRTLMEELHYGAEVGCDYTLLLDAANAIADLMDKAEKSRERGKWIPFLPEYGDMFECSVCKKVTRMAYKPKDLHIPMPYEYCPFCGAKMEEKE
jgi:hypothetical protein